MEDELKPIRAKDDGGTVPANARIRLVGCINNHSQPKCRTLALKGADGKFTLPCGYYSSFEVPMTLAFHRLIEEQTGIRVNDMSLFGVYTDQRHAEVILAFSVYAFKHQIHKRKSNALNTGSMRARRLMSFLILFSK